LADVEVIAATDVEHPLLGPMGAAQVFGPQKGADPETVVALERRLTEWAAEHTHLADDVAAAELVITGEGRFDDQSLHGKVVSARAAEARGTPVLVLAGQVTLTESALRDAGISAAYAIADHAGSVQRAIDDAANQLTGLAKVTADELGNSRITRYR
jgi:glycerate 2-kinase